MTETVEQNDIAQLAKDFIHALQNRTSFDDVARFYHHEIIQTEFPNLLTKNLTERNFAELKEASERGQKVMQKETYEITNHSVFKNMVTLEIVWRGTLAIPLGKLVAGDEIKAYIAQVSEFQDGKIIRQRNYDCFEPFL